MAQELGMSTPLMLPRILAGNSLAWNSGMGSGDSSGCSRPADTLCCLLIPITSSLFGFPGRLALAARPTDTGQPWPVRSRGERWGAGLPHPTALDGAAIQQYCLDCTVPAAERGGRWFGSPCRLGTPGEPSRASSMPGRLAGHPGWDVPPALPQERSGPYTGLDSPSPVPAWSPRGYRRAHG